MKQENIKSHKLTNLVHTVFLLVSMAGLLGLLGWMIAGAAGIKVAMALGIISFLLTPRLPSRLIMRTYRAKQLYPNAVPRLYRITRTLSERAGLDRVPALYYLPSRVLNAFAVGTREDSAICITDGLLRALSANEIAGIIGHEITHIKNNDMQVMGLAAFFSRLTGYGSLLGQILFVLFLPVMLISDMNVPVLPFLLLIFAPALSLIMQLALSRTREFEADLGSCVLTGNSYFLASALSRLEQYQKRQWKNFFIPASISRQVNLLRTHPSTKERIRRLLSLSLDGYHLPGPGPAG